MPSREKFFCEKSEKNAKETPVRIKGLEGKLKIAKYFIQIAILSNFINYCKKKKKKRVLEKGNLRNKI
jgi:hypothetical protein